MSDTREVLKKIAALRLRLDEAQSLGGETVAAGKSRMAAMEEKVQHGHWHHALLDEAMREAADPVEAPLPSRLTHRAAKVVQTARDLLQQLKALAEDPILCIRRLTPVGSPGAEDPLAELHRQTAGMIDAVLRNVQTMPPAASVQMRLCAGLETILDVVGQRLGTIKAAIGQRSFEEGRIDRLAELLRRIAGGQSADITALQQLAAEVHDDARQGMPLRFLHAGADDPARHVAAHGLTVAQVVARLVQGDSAWVGRELDGVTAALVHDVGMVRLPGEILSQAGPLTEDQRRLVERHPLAGAQALVKLWPGGGWPIDAAADHHERCDGVGYPRGKRDLQLSDEAKLLAVCDVYAALASERAHRPAHEPRTALTDTLLLADEGTLDKRLAERLLTLSFYPAGSVVQLDDGAVALVMAAQAGDKALAHPARPVVTVLCDPLGPAPALPRLLDLARQSDRSIARSLSKSERRLALGSAYPELV